MDDHKIHKLLAVLILLCLTAAGLWPVAAQQAEPPSAGVVSADDYKAGEILVKFKEGVTALSTQSILDRYDAAYVRTLYGSAVELWQVPVGNEVATAEALSANPLVEYAEPNYRVYALSKVPNDPYFSQQWAHTIIQSTAAWDITTGSTAVTIAILDTGVDMAHPDLASKMVSGYDYVDNDTTPYDLNGHGTHVAGIAAAITNNNVGVAGMDWNARIMPVRVLDEEGSGYTDDLVDGIDWAYSHGAKVLNMSLGGPFPSLSVQAAVNAAYDAGSLIVAAMGNENSLLPSYPAAHENVLAVAATGPTDSRAPYSNYGFHCDVAAPGGAMSYLHDPNGIYSTMPTYPVYLTTQRGYSQNYDYLQGTSQATPYVSGLAALLWAVSPSLTPAQVESYIETSAGDLGQQGWDQYYGHGRIDAQKALSAILPTTPDLAPIDNGDGDGTYLVDWSNVPNATSYTLQEDDNSSFGSPVTRYSGPDSQLQVTGQQGGIWYYRVRASNSGGDSNWSNTRSVGVKPGAPTLVPINNPSHQGDYQLVWSAVPGASSYELEEDNSPSFSSPDVLYAGTALQHQVTGRMGGTWYYRVRAGNSVGKGPWSNIQWVTVLPDAPELLTINNPANKDEYEVAWLAPAGANGYILEEYDNGGLNDPVLRYRGTALQYSVTGQQNGTWHYRVRAYNTAGEGPWSEPQSTTVDVASLPRPELLPIENADGDGEFLVRWTAVPTATRYRLEESRNPYFVALTEVYTDTVTETLRLDQPGGTWHYRVRALGDGIRSPWSEPKYAIVIVRLYLPVVAKN